MTNTPHGKLRPSRLAIITALAFCVGAPKAFADSPLDVQLSIILEGIYHERLSKGNTEPAGFGHDHHHDHGHHHDHDHGLDSGFNLGHSELAFEARLGDLLDGAVMLGFDANHIEVEEAYIRTLSLPAGFQLKGGKFLSDIGYVNSHHGHDWHFVQRPLVNEYLFGHHGLLDTGLQASYVPATAWYTQLGIEVFQGQEDEGIARLDDGLPINLKDGPRLFTAFAKLGPDLGDYHALQTGVSAGYVRDYGRIEDHGNHAHAVTGNAFFTGVDAVYRYYAGRGYGHGDWRIAGEYFLVERNVDEHLERIHGGHQYWVKRDRYTEQQDGMYLETVYGFRPRWELGLRAEALGLKNRVLDFHPTAIQAFDTSYRYAAQLTFRPAEPVFIRAQLSYDDFAFDDHHHDHDHGHAHEHHEGRNLSFLLQLNVALGACGARRSTRLANTP
ncbi:hypothetical protein [Thiorhodospira sibirica]|uniref:hypothetical protein n=1 Tax=Thiorhodospira sibirica TaxID=154347 RepID=UPI00022C4C88